MFEESRFSFGGGRSGLFSFQEEAMRRVGKAPVTMGIRTGASRLGVGEVTYGTWR